MDLRTDAEGVLHYFGMAKTPDDAGPLPHTPYRNIIYGCYGNDAEAHYFAEAGYWPFMAEHVLFSINAQPLYKSNPECGSRSRNWQYFAVAQAGNNDLYVGIEVAAEKHPKN